MPKWGQATHGMNKPMSVYVHQDVRNKVKARLFEQGGEFSALVESLLGSRREQGQVV